jgi:endonuclease YncB( thermonuclease family)
MRSILALAALLSFALPAVAQDRPRPERKPPDCAAALGPLPKSWEGEAYALAGDGLGGVGLKPQIRLWGIRAPTVRAPDTDERVAGMRARAALEDLLAAGDHRISCRAAGWDGECGLLAQCTVTVAMPAGSPPAPHDLALRLLEDGLAYGFHLEAALPWDKAASARYAHYEAIARQAHKGLWPVWLAEPQAEAPAEK